MATLLSTQIARGDPIRDPRPGTPVTVFGDYVMTGSEATADVVQMVKVPLGARVVDMVLVSQDLGGTVTTDVGDGVDPDRYIVDAALGTAGGLVVRPTATQALLHFTYTADDTIDLTLESVATPIAAATVSLAVTYVLNHG